MTNLISRRLNRIMTSLEDTAELQIFRLGYIGTNANDNIKFNQEFNRFIEQLYLMEHFENGKANTIVVCGTVNLNQVKLIQEMYENINEKNKYLVHLSGGLSEELINKSYFLVNKLSDYVHVDLTYKAYPYGLDDIILGLKQLPRRGE